MLSLLILDNTSNTAVRTFYNTFFIYFSKCLCPFEMHESLADEDYSKIIYELRDEHIELLYFLYIRDYSTQKLAAMRNRSDRNIRGVRSTVLGQIEKKVLLVLADRLGQDFPFIGEERDFLSRHAKDLPTALEKLDKEKLILLKKIGVMVRKIAREQAKPSIYNPIKHYEKLVLTAINIGTTAMNKASELTVKEAIMSFVSEYGMLGLMTALPTTPDFITYETVYLPKNHFIREESISTEKYLSCFFPFDKIDFLKKGIESVWSADSPEMIALLMTMKNKPQAVMMSFQREYAESYEWLVEVFRDWAFTFFSSFLYYQDYDKLDKNEWSLYRQGMAAFGGVAPTYHIELRERPTLVWDFNSLLLCVQMMFSFMLTDDDSSLKLCKHCGKAFAAARSNMEFCSPQCKNQYNVYKSRSKKNNIPT